MGSDRVPEQRATERAATGASPSEARADSTRLTRRAGRSRGPQAAARRRTEERLLEGALRAVACRGLAKLGMSDVSDYAGVSRGTAYRYFQNTEVLLRELGRREAERFERQVWEALEEAPPGEERLRIVLDYVGKLAREHPLVQRLPETDPGVVLTSLRERFPDIRDAFQRLLVPLLEETNLVRRGVVTAEQLAGWMARMMISMFLFPEPDPDETAEAMRTVYQILARGQKGTTPAPGDDRVQADRRVSSSEKPKEKRQG